MSTGDSERFRVHSQRYEDRQLGSKRKCILKGGYLNVCANNATSLKIHLQRGEQLRIYSQSNMGE